MNEKFLRLRDEVLAEIDLAPGHVPDDLPPLSTDGLAGETRDDKQVRFYHLWERLQHFRPDDLTTDEAAARDRLAAYVGKVLNQLHQPVTRSG